MSDEYTPDDVDVEVYFALGAVEYRVGGGGVSISEAHDAYRAWLAAHDKALREQIARDVEQYGESFMEDIRSTLGHTPDWVTTYSDGLDSAARIARGEDQTDE